MQEALDLLAEPGVDHLVWISIASSRSLARRSIARSATGMAIVRAWLNAALCAVLSRHSASFGPDPETPNRRGLPRPGLEMTPDLGHIRRAVLQGLGGQDVMGIGVVGRP